MTTARRWLASRPGPCFMWILIIAVLLLLRSFWIYMRTPRSSLAYSEEPLFNRIGPVKSPLERNCLALNGDDCQLSPSVEVEIPHKGLFAHDKQFFLDGKPIRLLSGSFHYFRTHPTQWADRLLRIKAAGLNTVSTYIPWNLHEPSPNSFNFGGTWDIAAFIRAVEAAGLRLIVRPGPYICAEWEWGGLPAWLLSDPYMRVRTSKYQPYIRYVERYFDKLLPILAQYQHTQGKGPIIAFQLENELGSYVSDSTYLLTIHRLFIKHGLVELFFTSDGSEHLTQNPAITGVLRTVNFGSTGAKYSPDIHAAELVRVQPEMPVFVAEWWSGWFDHWTEDHHVLNVTDTKRSLTQLLTKYNASVNFYMFVGGTNFGFWNGANAGGKGYMPTITSYDYDAPVSECGDVTPKYAMIRELFLSLDLVRDLPPVPPNPAKFGLGMVTLDSHMLYSDLIGLSPAQNLKLANPTTMEQLLMQDQAGQSLGFLLYRTTFKRAVLPETQQKPEAHLLVRGGIHDRGMLLINGRHLANTSWRNQTANDLYFVLENLEAENTLDILVENMGRVNFGGDLNGQRKGIEGEIHLDGEKVVGWQHIPLTFDEPFMTQLSASPRWERLLPNVPQSVAAPAAIRGHFQADPPLKDTFLDMRSMDKGAVWVNGWPLGRYWSEGPQKTLYVPAPVLLEGTNEIIVFELHRVSNSVAFIHTPDLGPTQS